MWDKLTTPEVRAALVKPTPENLATVKAFWTAVLDQAETEQDTMYYGASWHKVARDQVANTRWDDDVCTIYSWKLLKGSTERMVNRFTHAARQVVLRAEESHR